MNKITVEARNELDNEEEIIGNVDGTRFKLYYKIETLPKAELFIYRYLTFDEAVQYWRNISNYLFDNGYITHAFHIWNIDNFDNFTYVRLAHSDECANGECIFVGVQK